MNDWKKSNYDLICVGLYEENELTPLAMTIDTHANGGLRSAIQSVKLSGKSGKNEFILVDDRPVLVLGLGKKADFDLSNARNVAATAARQAIARKFSSVAVECFPLEGGADQAVSEGLVLGSYQYLNYKTQDKDVFELESAAVLGGDESQVAKGAVIAASVCYARDLENAPGNSTTPSKLAESARRIAKTGGMKVTILDREEFTEMGMGALAAVASGTDEPPKFIVVEYNGGGDEKPVALVGKGLTFDSGGISIKPGAGMDEMKFDMCGSGVVLGVLKAVSTLKPKFNLVCVIPSTENLSGGKAYKPGDILTAYNGKTIEVLNTDAEGRLILADGLSYVSKHYDPEYILDFATLTGAVLVALGHIATGVLGTDDDLMNRVKAASQATGEKVWELPLWDEYCEQVKSKIADVKNVGEARQAGTIAGAAFLKEFVKEGIPWVHFDIAGTAWGGKESPLVYQQGATGAVIRLVLNLLGI
ncbi:MAG: leucyl aminopeptidase [FCB group bacterium]|nr:leucyl aminopeptidase [FCB group bacterium]